MTMRAMAPMTAHQAMVMGIDGTRGSTRRRNAHAERLGPDATMNGVEAAVSSARRGARGGKDERALLAMTMAGTMAAPRLHLRRARAVAPKWSMTVVVMLVVVAVTTTMIAASGGRTAAGSRVAAQRWSVIGSGETHVASAAMPEGRPFLSQPSTIRGECQPSVAGHSMRGEVRQARSSLYRWVCRLVVDLAAESLRQGEADRRGGAARNNVVAAGGE